MTALTPMATCDMRVGEMPSARAPSKSSDTADSIRPMRVKR